MRAGVGMLGIDRAALIEVSSGVESLFYDKQGLGL
jgi:hypothetical protein